MLNKENKKSLCCHGVLAWIIVTLLALILIILVFKVGIMIGSLKANFSSCKYDYKSKKSIIEKYEAKAEAMGMTIEEFKKYLEEQEKNKYEKLEEDNK